MKVRRFSIILSERDKDLTNTSIIERIKAEMLPALSNCSEVHFGNGRKENVTTIQAEAFSTPNYHFVKNEIESTLDRYRTMYPQVYVKKDLQDNADTIRLTLEVGFKTMQS